MALYSLALPLTPDGRDEQSHNQEVAPYGIL